MEHGKEFRRDANDIISNCNMKTSEGNLDKGEELCLKALSDLAWKLTIASKKMDKALESLIKYS